MQHNKCTDNLGEFKKFIDSNNKTGICLEDTSSIGKTGIRTAPGTNADRHHHPGHDAIYDVATV
jgi:hypothetical protein